MHSETHSIQKNDFLFGKSIENIIKGRVVIPLTNVFNVNAEEFIDAYCKEDGFDQAPIDIKYVSEEQNDGEDALDNSYVYNPRTKTFHKTEGNAWAFHLDHDFYESSSDDQKRVLDHWLYYWPFTAYSDDSYMFDSIFGYQLEDTMGRLMDQGISIGNLDFDTYNQEDVDKILENGNEDDINLVHSYIDIYSSNEKFQKVYKNRKELPEHKIRSFIEKGELPQIMIDYLKFFLKNKEVIMKINLALTPQAFAPQNLVYPKGTEMYINTCVWETEYNVYYPSFPHPYYSFSLKELKKIYKIFDLYGQRYFLY